MINSVLVYSENNPKCPFPFVYSIAYLCTWSWLIWFSCVRWFSWVSWLSTATCWAPNKGLRAPLPPGYFNKDGGTWKKTQDDCSAFRTEDLNWKKFWSAGSSTSSWQAEWNTKQISVHSRSTWEGRMGGGTWLRRLGWGGTWEWGPPRPCATLLPPIIGFTF